MCVKIAERGGGNLRTAPALTPLTLVSLTYLSQCKCEFGQREINNFLAFYSCVVESVRQHQILEKIKLLLSLDRD